MLSDIQADALLPIVISDNAIRDQKVTLIRRLRDMPLLENIRTLNLNEDVLCDFRRDTAVETVLCQQTKPTK